MPTQKRGLRRHVRDAAIQAAILAAALTGSSAAMGDSATLLVQGSLCDNPSDAVNYQWAAQKFGAAPLFFMQKNGSVAALTKGAVFDKFDSIYITAHGSPGGVGDFTGANFATHFQAAHKSTPKLAYFNSCSAAVPPSGGSSNLKVFAAAYGNKVPTLRGPAGPGCRLAGDGKPDLKDADLKYGVAPSNQGQYDQIVKNIETEWDKGRYAQSGKTYVAACQDLMSSFDEARALAFVNTVANDFTTTPRRPIKDTFNYLELVRLNAGGQPLFTCGADHKDACP